MNVLTGETGAGKSLIIDALSLLRGGRAQSELVREGADVAHVQAQFGLSGSTGAAVVAFLKEHGIEGDGDEGLVVERVVSRQGRGRSRLQAELTTQAMLRAVGERLVDICSQHEHHSLTHVKRHIELLDSYAKLDAELARYAETYGEWRKLSSELEELRERTGERFQRIDYLRFQLEELDRLEPQVGEYQQLRGRVELLRNGRDWISFASEAQHSLYEADDAIAGRLAGLLERANRGSEDSPLLAEMAGQLESAQIACEEAAAAAARLSQEFDVDGAELEGLEARLDELDRLRHKHACSVDELPQRRDVMHATLQQLENVEERAAELASLEAGAQQRCRGLARGLHQGRLDAATAFAGAVETRLAALHIPNARIRAQIEFEASGELGPRGGDRVEFMFSANEGESLGPLSKVASGGELSRVLLALKGVLATGDHVATYVFDEVDAGVGGAVAEAIGRELSRAAADRQVLCITHLPQIAAFAQAHFRVEKCSEGGRTRTRVVRLDDRARVEELARMMAGARVTPRAREHAAELLSGARRKHRGTKRRRSATAVPT